MQTSHAEHPYVLREWELNAFLIESILAGAGLWAIVGFGGPHLIASLPRSLWSGIGFLLLGLSGIPFQTVYGRAHGHAVSIRRRVVSMFIAATLFAVVSAYWH